MFVLSVCCAVVAVVYAQVLTDPGMVFNGLYLWLEKKLPEWLFKPIIGCYKCVAGQIGLWSYPLLCDYSIPGHIFFICNTILAAIIINKALQYAEND